MILWTVWKNWQEQTLSWRNLLKFFLDGKKKKKKKRFHVFDPSLIEIRKKKFDLFPSVLLSKFLSVSLSFIQAKEYIGQRRTIYHCPSSLRRSHEDRVKRMKISKTCSTVLKKVEGCRVTEEDGKLISPKGETKARIRTHFSLQWTHFFLSFLPLPLPLSLPYHVEAISREDYLLKAFSVLVAVNGGKRGII